MSTPLTIECPIHFNRQARGRKQVRSGEAPRLPCAPGRVPRVAKLLALAHRFDGLLREGAVKDYAELGRLGHVTRARISQVMNLLYLAPDIQEAVLFLPRTVRGRDPIQMYHLQPIALTADWKKQRRIWQRLLDAAMDTTLQD